MTRPTSLALVLLLLLAGCGGGPAKLPETKPKKATIGEYVALGDSYTAAPYVPNTDVAGGCLRSDHNYPSLLAKALKIKNLVDVSCSGATSADLIKPVTNRLGTLPPQTDALSKNTRLVTVGISGNDFGLFGHLFFNCGATRKCQIGEHRDEFIAAVEATGKFLPLTLAKIKALAPQARVFLIGYPKLVPDKGSCAGLPNLTGGNLDLANEINEKLSDVMAAAAKTAKVGFIDVYQASLGHDICAPQPWINGQVTDVTRAAGLHPFQVEQQAVAKLLMAALDSTTTPRLDGPLGCAA